MRESCKETTNFPSPADKQNAQRTRQPASHLSLNPLYREDIIMQYMCIL